MKSPTVPSPLLPVLRCAIYTRKSTDEALDNQFSSVDSQRESGENYIASQRHLGWYCLPDRYDDAGYSGGTMERPALQRLLRDVEAGRINVVVTYKIDRLSRALSDSVKILEHFDRFGVTYVSVTESISTSTPHGRMHLNMLASFAQYERELDGERIRDKIAAIKARGRYIGPPLLGYDTDPVTHVMAVNKAEAALVLHIFERFAEIKSITLLARELNAAGHQMKTFITQAGHPHRGGPFKKDGLYRLLHSRIYMGQVTHKDKVYPGQQEAIVSRELWEQVQGIIGTDVVARRSRVRSAAPMMLKGVIHCGHCGLAMIPNWTQKNGRQYRFYICGRTAKSGADACPVGRISAGEVEAVVLKQLSVVWKSPELILATLHGGEAVINQERQRYEQDRQMVEAELQNTVAKRNQQAGAGATITLDPQINYLQGEHARILDELERLDGEQLTHPEVLAALGNIETVWAEMTPVEQNRVITLLVDSVVITTDGIEIAIRTDGIKSLQPEPEVRRVRAAIALRS